MNYYGYKIGDRLQQRTRGNGWEQGAMVATITGIDTDCFLYFDNRVGKYSAEYLDKHFKVIGEKMKEKLLQFHELEEGKVYRLLHGGSRDHGYDYELRSTGRLYNTSKGRTSSVIFDNSIRFKEVPRKDIRTYDSLDFEVEFGGWMLTVGCQSISKVSAIQLAKDILEKYDE